MAHTSGLDLKIAAMSRRIRGSEIAAEMGVSPDRIYQLWMVARVTETAARRYFAALDAVERRTDGHNSDDTEVASA